ncbi:MAG: FtsW/RodA/SpoVE family cell cycle protein, partial [Candidatus Cryptobacteroides sp.]
MEKKGFLNVIKGDKVVWIVVLLLIMISMITISGSTSLLAIQNKTTRLAIIYRQSLITLLGLALIFICYFIPKLKPFEVVSRFGFLISVILLAALDSRFKLSHNFMAEEFNGAYRAIRVFGFQVHIFEVVKVAMVMYISWACKALKEGKTSTLDFFASIKLGKEGKKPFKALDSDWGRVLYYVLVPVMVVTALVLPGGNSSTVFILAIMIITAFVGGIDPGKIAAMTVAGLLLLCTLFGIYKISDGKYFHRIGTGIERVSEKPTIDEVIQMKKDGQESTKEYKKKMKKIQQP